MGWTSPRVLVLLGVGVLSLIAFVVDRAALARSDVPRCRCCAIRAFTFGTLSTFLAAIARGGLMFMLIIWLQGIWLPQHGVELRATRRCGRASTCCR